MKKKNYQFNFSLPTIELSKTAWSKWLPTRGNVIFVGIVLAVLFGANKVGALTLFAPAAAPAASNNTVAYQGRIADTAGQPINGTRSMTFRLYNAASGGAPLWMESWGGSSSVAISDGLFNVMLGTLNPINSSVFTSNSNVWLGLSIDTDPEMTPRIQIGSAAYAIQALTVPDGSIASGKLADGAVSNSKIADGSVNALKLSEASVGTGKIVDGAVNTTKIVDGAVGTSKIADSSITTAKLADGSVGTADIASNAVTSEKLTLGPLSTNGDFAVKGQSAVDRNIRFNPASLPILRADGTRILHVLPWGGVGSDYDKVCVGCGAPADLEVKGKIVAPNIIDAQQSGHRMGWGSAVVNTGNGFANITFDAAFAGAPLVVAVNGDNNAGSFIVNIGTVTNSTFQVYLQNADGTPKTGASRINYFVLGAK